ncbi:TonB-dependent siderophore receptor [Acinetobacter boissieri]|uniref:Outer-membrane receptor for ferric coprogen and ferric-rhodotorulic acid n=1 Tax=Acinetobacter boissieri TaxID=1219383 RepID=A0A1G6GGX8_9GAMM|nr:TonB-dependent siderophore receptor [Acinetobacter boissieri]SDB81261.1 outer-membrane receptor for ferric coprogen and ferric-rhodotorulic acid [Acinetobacter boissieri]
MSDYPQSFLLKPLCASLFAISMHSFAAETPVSDATPLETIRAESNKSSTMKTATGLELTQKETPQSISVVTQEQIKDQSLTTVTSAMKQATGINVIRDSGRFRYQSRGFYIDQIEEDGLSSTMPGSGSNAYRTSSSFTDLDIYDHIEVVRGATGLTQAYSEPGGTLNAVRKHPTKEFQMQGYLQAGSWNNLRSVFDVSGSLNSNESVRGRFVAIGTDSDSYKNNVSKDNQTFYGVLDFDLTPATLLRIGAMYQKSHEVPDYFGIPMALGGVDSGLPASIYLGSSWSKLNFEKYNAFAELEHKFNDDWSLNAQVNSTWSKSLQNVGGLAQLGTSYAGLTSSNQKLAMNNYQYYDNSSDELTAKISLNGKYNLFNATHDVFANLNYVSTYEKSEWRRILNSTAYDVTTFNPASVAVPNWNGALNLNWFYTNYITQTAATLGTRVNLLQDVYLTLAGRYAQSITNGSTYYAITGGKTDGEYAKNREVKKNKFIPYIGLTYDLTDNTSLYASHTEIFKPQSNRDLSGQILDPIVGKNDEIGIKSELFGGLLNASLALFQIEQENRPIAATYNNISFSVPSGKVRSRGIDIEVSGKITNDLAIFAGYTYNKSKYLNTESLTYLSGSNFSKHTPEHMFKLYSQYQLPGALKKWSAGVGVTAQTDTNSLYNIYQGGYTLWNANIRYSYSQNLSFNLIGDNITNKRYYENNRVRINGGNNFLGSPASVLLRVDWTY